MRTELGIMRQILRTCKRAGWAVSSVDNGAGEDVRVETEAETLAEATATGMSRVYLRRGGQRAWLFFVLGNMPYEVLNDYTTNLDPELGAYLRTLED